MIGIANVLMFSNPRRKIRRRGFCYLLVFIRKRPTDIFDTEYPSPILDAGVIYNNEC